MEEPLNTPLLKKVWGDPTLTIISRNAGVRGGSSSFLREGTIIRGTHKGQRTKTDPPFQTFHKAGYPSVFEPVVIGSKTNYVS